MPEKFDVTLGIVKSLHSRIILAIWIVWWVLDTGFLWWSESISQGLCSTTSPLPWQLSTLDQGQLSIHGQLPFVGQGGLLGLGVCGNSFPPHWVVGSLLLAVAIVVRRKLGILGWVLVAVVQVAVALFVLRIL